MTAFKFNLVATDTGQFLDRGTLVFDVRHVDFAGGAKGDDTADDRAAIQAAIDAAHAAGGGTVVIPDGTYLTGTPLPNTTTPVPIQIKSNVRVVIMPGATVKAATGNWGSRGIFEAVVQNNVSIEGGGTIDGQRSLNAGGRLFAIYLQSVQGFSVRGLRIVNIPANSGPDNPAGWGGDAVLMSHEYLGVQTPCRDGVVEGCYIENVERCGISPLCAERVSIRDNIIRNVRTEQPQPNPACGIDLEPDKLGLVIRDITISGNHIEDCDGGGILVNGNGPRDVTVVGNTIRNVDMDAIYVRATNVTVKGNTINNWKGRGIWVYNGSIGVVVEGNTIEGDYTNTAQRAGIAVTDASDVVITGNTVRRTFTGGIRIDVSSLGAQGKDYPRNARRIVIANNTLFAIGRPEEVGGAAITLVSSATASPPRVIEDVVIAMNTISDGYDPDYDIVPEQTNPEDPPFNPEEKSIRTGDKRTDYGIDVAGISPAERAKVHIFGNRITNMNVARVNGTYSVLSGHIIDRPTLNFGTIAAGASAEQTVAVTGAASGDSVQATPIGGLEAGLLIGGAWVSAAGQVTIRLHNVGGASIISGNRSWRVIVTQH